MEGNHSLASKLILTAQVSGTGLSQTSDLYSKVNMFETGLDIETRFLSMSWLRKQAGAHPKESEATQLRVEPP
jgi:hypothetical protein